MKIDRQVDRRERLGGWVAMALISLSVAGSFSCGGSSTSNSSILMPVVHGKTEALIRALEQGADPNQRIQGGCSVLVLAGTETTKVLLDHGADPNLVCNSGITPLHMAARRKNIDAAYYLLAAGADPNAKDKQGKTPGQIFAARAPQLVTEYDGFVAESDARLAASGNRKQELPETADPGPGSAMEAARAESVSEPDVSAWNAIRYDNDPQRIEAFAREYPDSVYYGSALERLVMLVKEREDYEPGSFESVRVVVKHPGALAYFTPDEHLWLVGPEGAKLRDIQDLLGQGVAAGVIAAKIRASREPYKELSMTDLGRLREAKVPDEVVQAMIEVTADVQAEVERKAEADELRAEMAQLREQVEAARRAAESAESAASASRSDTTSADGPQVVGGGEGKLQTKDGLLDVAESCAKRMVSLQACGQVPLAGRGVCKGIARKAFPCPGA